MWQGWCLGWLCDTWWLLVSRVSASDFQNSQVNVLHFSSVVLYHSHALGSTQNYEAPKMFLCIYKRRNCSVRFVCLRSARQLGRRGRFKSCRWRWGVRTQSPSLEYHKVCAPIHGIDRKMLFFLQNSFTVPLHIQMHISHPSNFFFFFFSPG